MLYEYTGICQHCAEEVIITIHNDQLLENCPECGEPPFSLKRYKGLVYVVSNPYHPGVKIGYTMKSVEERIKNLNTTGVVEGYVPIVIFPSNRPRLDEKKIHGKLAKKKIAKEHYDLSPVEAALKCFNILGKKKAIFYDKSIEETFNLTREKNRIEMKLRLKGKGNF